MPDHHVFAVASGKGGVGKTTTAVNLGAAAAAAGRSVVVVDADLGMANVTDLLAVQPAGATLHDVLAGGVDAPAAAIPGPAGVDVLPGAPAVESFADADPANLPDAVAALRDRYDVVLLDVGAGLSHDTVVPLGVADGVVVVTTTQAAAVRDARKTMELTERFGGAVAGVVVVDRGGVDRTPDEVADALDADLLAAVPESPAVPESAEAGLPLREYAPEDAATRAYSAAAARLLGDEIPDDRDEGDDAGTADSAVAVEPAADAAGEADAAADPSDEEVGETDADDGAAGGDDSTGADADAETGEDDADDAAVAIEAESSEDEADTDDQDADEDDASEDDAGVVIEDAEAEGDDIDEADDPEAAVETVLGDDAADDADGAVPGDAMPTDLPGTDGEDGDGGETGSDTGWLSRLTGGRLG